MNDFDNNLDASVTIVNGCLIVTLPNDIIDSDMEIGSKMILARADRSSVKGVILDFSMISVIDSYNFSAFEKITKSLLFMGVTVIWIGLKSGVVSSLVDLDVDVSRITAAVNLEEALNMISNPRLNKNRGNS